MVFVFKEKTAYVMRISDWSADVCSSDLAAVPEVATAADGAFGALRVRLLDEAAHRHDAIGVRQGAAGLDVAVAGLGPRRRHTEGDHPSGRGGGRRARHRIVESRQVGNVMVGGLRQHQCLRELGSETRWERGCTYAELSGGVDT